MIGPANLVYRLEQSGPPDGYGPAGSFRVVGKENKFSAPDEIFHRDVTDLAQHPAVLGIIAIVTHPEYVTVRHGVNRRIIQLKIIAAFQYPVLDAVGKRLLELGDPDGGPQRTPYRKRLQTLTVDQFAVHEQAPVPDLNLVSREPDDTLDVVGAVVFGQFETGAFEGFWRLVERS